MIHSQYSECESDKLVRAYLPHPFGDEEIVRRFGEEVSTRMRLGGLVHCVAVAVRNRRLLLRTARPRKLSTGLTD